jgi:hypothetical protein
MGAVARKASEAVGARMNATAERFWHESAAMRAIGQACRRAHGLH